MGEPLDSMFSPRDLAVETIQAVHNDCSMFYDIWGEYFDEDEQAGHDFWLTRNRHGAGFWDGDWAEPEASFLTQASRAFGGVTWHVGDDGLIYQL